ncbi:MAG: diacylglycerol/lipid kinase family protein [Suipraeoptans sp.]
MYHFIVNPNARSGLGKSTWGVLEPLIVNMNIDYQVYETKYQRHAINIVHNITVNEGIHNIVVLGGDGTVNEVINGIYDLSRVVLGYIPIGSSNDFARGFHLPKDPEIALNNILSPVSYTMMDIGYITYGDNKRRRFGVSTGLGFDAAVCHQVMVSKLKVFLNKIKLGKLAYVAVAISQILSKDFEDMEITIDGVTTHYRKTIFAAAMNHKYEGGGFMFAPKANPGDGKLDVVVAANISKPGILCLLPLAFKGLHVYSKAITITQGTDIHFKSVKPLPIHTDGEPIFLRKEMSIGIEPDKLKVIIYN